MATIALLRQFLDQQVVEQYWWLARRRKPVGRLKRPCPVCTRQMREISISSEANLPPLDICKYCQLFWFDPREYDRIPEKISEEVNNIELHKQEIERIKRERKELLSNEPISASWQWPFVIFCVPIEAEVPRVRYYPWVTWLLTFSILVFSLFAFFDLKWAIATYGFIPDDILRYGGASMITAFFVHGGIMHLIFNLYYLMTFGDNVEDFLGKWLYGLLLLFATIVGNLAHYTVEPNSAIPVIGASGGISGVIAFYALRFPRAKMALLIGYIPLIVSVWVLFTFWLLLQIMGFLFQLKGLTSVSAAAHLGGFAVGVIFWAVENILSRRKISQLMKVVSGSILHDSEKKKSRSDSS